MMFYNEAKLLKEYEKDPKLKREDVRELLNWVSTNQHLPKITELQAILFLHSCYYDLDQAKKTVDAYFTIRTKNHDMFMVPDQNSIRNTMNIGFIQFLPKHTEEGYAILLVKILDSDASKYNFLAEVQMWNWLFMLHLHQYGVFEGLLVVYDLKGYTLGHLLKSNLFLVKKLLYYVQEALPVRIKGIHFFNPVFGADKIMKVVRPFLKKELSDMFTFHSSIDTVFEAIPQCLFPTDYGGETSSIDELHAKNLSNILSNMEFCKWHESQTVDEEKRENKTTSKRFVFF